MSEENDDFTIHTSNQAEQDQKSAKKKKFLAEKKLEKNGGKVVKKADLNKLKKPMEKKLKKITQKPTTDESKENLLDDGLEAPKKLKKFEKKLIRKQENIRRLDEHTGPLVSKVAKFSSLFKNNHEIPRIGDTEAPTDSVVKENLFSSNSFAHLNLSAHLTDCLEKRFKLKKMTQIQKKAYPPLWRAKTASSSLRRARARPWPMPYP
jgi:myosin heavy subunit